MDNPPGILEKPFSDPFTCFKRGLRYNSQGDYWKAILQLERALTAPLDAERQLDCLVTLAECYLKIGEYDKAAENYRSALVVAPGDQAIQVALEQCQEMKKDFHQAARSVLEKFQTTIPGIPAAASQSNPVEVTEESGERARGRDRQSIAVCVVGAVLFAGLILQAIDTSRPTATKAISAAHPPEHRGEIQSRRITVAASHAIEKPPAVEIKQTRKKNRLKHAYVHPADTIVFE